MKTWGEIKSECIHLGFEKTTAYQKNKGAFLEAANRAMLLIASTGRAVLNVCTVRHAPGENGAEENSAGGFVFPGGQKAAGEAHSGIPENDAEAGQNRVHEYDLPWIPYDIRSMEEKAAGRKVFLDFAAKPVFWADLDSVQRPWKPMERFRRQEGVLWLPVNVPGRYEVWYKRFPEAITAETPDSKPLEMEDDMAVLLPLLMAHYIWLDDDERKAILYWNQYDDLKKQLLNIHDPGAAPAAFRNTTGWW